MSEFLFSSARTGDAEQDLWGTPLDLFERLNAIFAFDTDVAAREANHLCERWFGPDHPDHFRRDAIASMHPFWGERCFLNPPYSRTAEFLRMAVDESDSGGAIVVALVFARTDTDWWWSHVLGRKSASRNRGGRAVGSRFDGPCASEILWIPGRLRFRAPDGRQAAGESAPAPSCIVIYRPGYREEWPKNGVFVP